MQTHTETSTHTHTHTQDEHFSFGYLNTETREGNMQTIHFGQANSWAMLGAGELYRESGFSFIPSPPSLGRGSNEQPRGMEWGGRREEGSGWGAHVYLWRIHFDIWQN